MAGAGRPDGRHRSHGGFHIGSEEERRKEYVFCNVSALKMQAGGFCGGRTGPAFTASPGVASYKAGIDKNFFFCYNICISARGVVETKRGESDE